MVAKSQRILWWKHGDPTNKAEGYEMYVHLFGGPPSPSSSYYTLKKISIDHQKQFGEYAAETIQRNFYVDDVLKSSVDTDTVLDLIMRVRKKFKPGGFN